MSTPRPLTDARAEQVLLEVTELAVRVRDSGLDAIAEQLDRVERTARGDLRAALAIAAVLIDPAAPIRPWWQEGLTVASREHLRVRGTRAGAIWHRRLGEHPCEPCREAELAYFRQQNRARGKRPKPPPPAHGTRNGWEKHRRAREEPCEPCRTAYRAYHAERQRVRRAKQRETTTGVAA